MGAPAHYFLQSRGIPHPGADMTNHAQVRARAATQLVPRVGKGCVRTAWRAGSRRAEAARQEGMLRGKEALLLRRARSTRVARVLLSRHFIPIGLQAALMANSGKAFPICR